MLCGRAVSHETGEETPLVSFDAERGGHVALSCEASGQRQAETRMERKEKGREKENE